GLPVRAIVFDLDGTLIDSLPDIADSVNQALFQLGLAQLTQEQVQSYIGSGVGNLIELSVPGGKDDPLFSDCLDLFRRQYQENIFNKTTAYHGLPEVVSQLASSCYGLAVMSNKFDILVKQLVAHFYAGSIKIALGESAQVPRKPLPDGLLAALELLQIPAMQAAYVGDSPGDIEAAHNGGLTAIGVTWGYRDAISLSQADYLVDSPAQLLQLICGNK
ncbi:MAG: HAD hydrolase-like protein, partial [Clostridiales bacterium]